MPILPSLTNGMLSIELFLKAIKAYDTIGARTKDGFFTKTHNIKNLFMDLSQVRQQNIQRKMESLGCTPRDFMVFLDEHKDDFVGDRYPFDKDQYSTNAGIMIKLLSVLPVLTDEITEDFVVQSDGSLEGSLPLPNFNVNAMLDPVSREILDNL